MTAQNIIVPYIRTTPVRVPRYDLVLPAGDSVSLTVTIIDFDTTFAQALELTTGLGGPQLGMGIWRDGTTDGWGWGWRDYGAPTYGYGCVHEMLWTGQGVYSPTVIGSFDFYLPSGTLWQWPRRCAWAVQLQHGRASADTLASGILNIIPGGMPPFLNPEVPLLTDTPETVLMDDGTTVVDAE